MAANKDKDFLMVTLTKAHIVDHLVTHVGLTRQQGRELVNACFEEICASLIAGHDIKLSGFGNFMLKDKTSRPGRNPKTGEKVAVTARRVVTFRASQKLRTQVEKASSRTKRVKSTEQPT